MAVELSTVHSTQSGTKTLATNQNPSPKPEVIGAQPADENSLPLKEDAVGYREYVEGLNLEFSDKEARRVRWKIDLVIIPIFLITQALQSLDKAALNYANLFGYQEALGLHGNQFNYLSGVIYAGYFFGQYPCGWLIGRYSAQKVMSLAILFWGALVLILARCRSYSSALAVRFFMGVFEAAVTPGLTLMTGFWYTRNEIPLRQCIWYSALGWGGIIGSYISKGISTLPSDFTPDRWELIFYILGSITVFWALIVYLFLPDSPSSASSPFSFLRRHRERVIAVKRVAGNETGIKNRRFDKKQALLASSIYRDPKVLLIFISIFASAIPNGVVNSFSTVIIKDLGGFSTERTTELKSVGDAVQIVALFIAGIVTLNVPNTRLITAIIADALCTVAAALMAYLPRANTWGRLVSFWLVNSQSVGFTVSLTTISSNMAGYTHRAFASAVIFTAYCWGGFAGPFVVKASEAPDYPSATVGLLVGYTIKLVCHVALLGYMYHTNKWRDRVYGPANKEASDEAGMRDQTEFENKDFRYVL